MELESTRGASSGRELSSDVQMKDASAEMEGPLEGDTSRDADASSELSPVPPSAMKTKQMSKMWQNVSSEDELSLAAETPFKTPIVAPVIKQDAALAAQLEAGSDRRYSLRTRGRSVATYANTPMTEVSASPSEPASVASTPPRSTRKKKGTAQVKKPTSRGKTTLRRGEKT